MLTAFSDDLTVRKDAAAAIALLVIDPARRAKAMKHLDAATSLVAKAAEEAAGDPSVGLKLLASAAARVNAGAALVEDLPAFAAAPEDIHVFRPGGRGFLYLINRTGQPFTVEDVSFDVSALFYDGTGATARLTQGKLLEKYFVSPPSPVVAADESYDCSGEVFGTLFEALATKRKTGLQGFSGRAIVRIAGRDPFVVGFNGR